MAKKAYIGIGGKNLVNVVDRRGETGAGVVWETRNGSIYILSDNNSTQLEVVAGVTPSEFQTAVPPGTYTLYTKTACDVYRAPVKADGSFGNRVYMYCNDIITFTSDTSFIIADLQLYVAPTTFSKFPLTPMLLRGEYTLDTLPPEEPWRGGEYGVARKVKKGYIGVNTETQSVARRIKKAYIGIGGVARPCFGSGKPEYYGTTTHGLLGGGGNMVGFSVGNYGLFGGGKYPISGELNWETWESNFTFSNSAIVTAYDKSLTRSQAPSLNVARYESKAATINNTFAVVTSGVTGSYYDWDMGYDVYTYSNAAEGYNESLTRTVGTGYAVHRHAGASVGNYAIFAGGSDGWGSSPSGLAFDASMTKKSCSLSIGRECAAGASVGNYALIAGHYMTPADLPTRDTVDAFDTSLTRRAAPVMRNYSGKRAGVTTSKYALFAGGQAAGAIIPDVDAYDASLTRTTAPNLSADITNPPSAAIGEYALFRINGSTTDIYDASLTKTTINHANAGFGEAGTNVGNFALFAGGYYAEIGGDSGMDAIYGIVDTVNAFTLV